MCSPRLLLLVPASLLTCCEATAATYTIRPDGTGHYASIQEGIWACVNGDTLLLADGTFTGPLNRNLDFGGLTIVVASAGGNPATCIIDCERQPGETRRGFYFHSGEGPGAVLRGITIRNGQGDPG